MIEDVPPGSLPRESSDARRRETLAQQLHAVIRHGAGVRTPEVFTRMIGIFDELARAARITTRVWSDALATSLAVGTKRETPRDSP